MFCHQTGGLVTGMGGRCERAYNRNFTPCVTVTDKTIVVLQLHLVHWNSESHASFKDAVGSGDPNGLCVLGFFLKVTLDWGS